MRATRSRTTWRAFGLAFAIALAPGLMQSEASCGALEYGEARLEILNVVAGEEDLIAFEPDEHAYEVMLPEETGMILVRAKSIDPAASVAYSQSDGCEEVAGESLPEGGGFFVLESVPEGHSLLTIRVKAPEGSSGAYTVFFARPEQCQ